MHGRRRRLRRAGRGRARSSAARRRSISSSARRPITACRMRCARVARAARRSSRPTSRIEDKFEHLPQPRARRDRRARRHRLPHRAGRLRQVLHLLRRALYARRRSLAPGRADRRRGRAAWPRPACARSRCSARTSTPGTARAPDGARLGARPAAAPAGARSPASTRLRYTTSHPRDMDDELIAAHRDLPQLMPYLHLPVQSGSDRILKAMNRRHTAADYLALVERIRAARPDIALSGDFIVGFPGETDADFEATLRSGARRSATRRPIRSSIRRAPARPAPSMPDQVRGSGQGRAAAARCRRCLREQQRDFNRRHGRQDDRRAVREARPPARPDASAARPGCSR